MSTLSGGALTSMAHAPVGVVWPDSTSDIVTDSALALPTAAGRTVVGGPSWVGLIRSGGVPGLAAPLVVAAYAA